jgi:hypothetical protein
MDARVEYCCSADQTHKSEGKEAVIKVESASRGQANAYTTEKAQDGKAEEYTQSNLIDKSVLNDFVSSDLFRAC